MKRKYVFWAMLACIGVPLALVINAYTSRPVGCLDDWKLCKSNKDFMETNLAHIEAITACKMAAQDFAKFGNFPFSEYADPFGDSFVKTGKVELIEKHAQFQNGFGALGHLILTCDYDLDTKEVTRLNADAYTLT